MEPLCIIGVIGPEFQIEVTEWLKQYNIHTTVIVSDQVRYISKEGASREEIEPFLMKTIEIEADRMEYIDDGNMLLLEIKSNVWLPTPICGENSNPYILLAWFFDAIDPEVKKILQESDRWKGKKIKVTGFYVQ